MTRNFPMFVVKELFGALCNLLRDLTLDSFHHRFISSFSKIPYLPESVNTSIITNLKTILNISFWTLLVSTLDSFFHALAWFPMPSKNALFTRNVLWQLHGQVEAAFSVGVQSVDFRVIHLQWNEALFRFCKQMCVMQTFLFEADKLSKVTNRFPLRYCEDIGWIWKCPNGLPPVEWSHR